MDRIVLLIDMDCFYVQVHQKDRTETVGKPCAVVQYSSANAASLIAVSYEARALGITRIMNGEAAKKKCPEITIFQVPSRHGKADLRKYRDAGAEVIKSIFKFTSQIERASIDEAYIDVTDLILQNKCAAELSSISLKRSNLVVDPINFPNLSESLSEYTPPFSLPLDKLPEQIGIFDSLADGVKLKAALVLAQKIKDQILADTSYRCSVGVAANRMLAKIACSLNKPNKVTVVPAESIQHLMNFTHTKKVPNMGGKLGVDLTTRFNLEFFGMLTEIPLNLLTEEYGEKTGSWLYDLCRGQDQQAVSVRTLVQSIACSKNFFGKFALKTEKEARDWLASLATELVERVSLDRSAHKRIPTSLTVHVRCAALSSSKISNTRQDVYGSSSGQSKAITPQILSLIKPKDQIGGEASQSTQESEVIGKIVELSLIALQNTLKPGKEWNPPIVNLGLTAGKFRPDASSSNGNVQQLLKVQATVASNTKSTIVSFHDYSAKKTPFFHRFIVPIDSTPKNNVSSCEEDSPPEKKKNVLAVNQFQQKHAYVEKAHEKSPAPTPSTSSEPYQKHGEFFYRLDDVNSLVCEDCGSRVLIHLMPEHTDFHFARKVQQEWNEQIRPNPIQIPPTTSFSASIRGGKRGRKKGVAVSSEISRIHRKLDGFFVRH